MSTLNNQFSIIFITNSGQYKLDMAYLLQCYFIEDIFNMCMVGKLRFIDAQNIVEQGPLIGNEMIGIIVGEENRQFLFSTFKVMDVTAVSAIRSSEYPIIELIMTDPLFKPFTMSKFSKTWKFSEPIKNDRMVNKILEEMCDSKLDTWMFEQTNESIDNYTINGWSPAQAIQYLIRRSSGSIFDAPGYLFFQSSHFSENTAQNNLCTIEYLLNQDLESSLGGTGYEYVFDSGNLYYPNKILNFKKSGTDHYAYRKLAGGKKISFNFDTKTILEKTYTYNTMMNSGKITVLGNKSLFKDISTDINISPTDIEIVADYDERALENVMYYDFIKKYIIQQAVSIEVPGYPSRPCGDLILIRWPSTLSGEVKNKNLDGIYLVKSVTWNFMNRPPYFTQKLVLLKNGYSDSDVDLVEPAKKRTTGGTTIGGAA